MTKTATAVILLAMASAQGALYNLSGTINSSQEVPSNSSPGTGTILGTYDDVSNSLSWNISWSDLTSPATGMHFHGPAGPGVNAGVQVNIGAIGGLTSPTAGSATLTDPQETALINGLWYVNIHTSAFPGGEIRGQVIPTAIPEPASSTLALLAMGALGLRRRR